MKKVLFLLFVLLLVVAGADAARRSEVAKRDKNGKIARNANAKALFRKGHPCPSTGRTIGKCPGYVVDHIIALKRGGPDDPENMQWQTVEEARIKDRYE